MNLEISSYRETGPENLVEVDNYLSLLDKKVGLGVEEKKYDMKFYGGLVKGLREYGIEKIKADIAESDKIIVISERETDLVKERINYSRLLIDINGERYAINFLDSELNSKLDTSNAMGRYYNRSLFRLKISNEIFINLSVCENAFEEAADLVKQYNRDGKLDIYDFISGIITHEEYHKHNKLSPSEEEVKAEVGSLDVIGAPHLLVRLGTVYPEIIAEALHIASDEYYKFGDYKKYTEMYKRYTQALKNVIKTNNKEVEFENVKKSIIDNISSGHLGSWKEYKRSLHKAFSTILTPEMLKEIINEYKKLSEVK